MCSAQPYKEAAAVTELTALKQIHHIGIGGGGKWQDFRYIVACKTCNQGGKFLGHPPRKKLGF